MKKWKEKRLPFPVAGKYFWEFGEVPDVRREWGVGHWHPFPIGGVTNQLSVTSQYLNEDFVNKELLIANDDA